MKKIELTIYKGKTKVEAYNLDLDNQVEKYMRWFVGAVADEGGTRVRVSLKQDGLIVKQWVSTTGNGFSDFITEMTENLVEERMVSTLGGLWTAS